MAEQSLSPVGLAIAWRMNAANDLAHYAVYRGLSGDFVPGPENVIATPAVPEWFDGSWQWDSGYCYKISAVDVHGNQSGFALLSPDDVTGDGDSEAPAASYLSQNYPNPFNPATKIAFGLSAPAHVSLRIYDVSAARAGARRRDAAGRQLHRALERPRLERPFGCERELLLPAGNRRRPSDAAIVAREVIGSG